MIEHQKCIRCQIIKSVMEFHTEKGSKSGYRAVCKLCRKLHKLTGTKLPRGVPRRPIEDRFWEKVKKTETCWLWTGYKYRCSYGYIGIGGQKTKSIGAHRLSYTIHYGFIPKGMVVCHQCDTPLCVRPDHLFLGMPASNVADCLQKGREARGEKNGQSKLTATEVIEIRKLYRTGNITQDTLAERFKVSRSAIYKIVYYLRWKHI